jgi:hypothetical protein
MATLLFGEEVRVDVGAVGAVVDRVPGRVGRRGTWHPPPPRNPAPRRREVEESGDLIPAASRRTSIPVGTRTATR